MKIKVGVIGANGNIGRQSLEIIQGDKNLVLDFVVINKNIDYINKNLTKIKVQHFCIIDAKVDPKFIAKLKKAKKKVIIGKKNIFKFIQKCKSDIILNAVSGFNGLEWSLKVIEAKIDLALANKESLVVAGKEIMHLAKQKKVTIFPVDSEHSAIFQCLQGEDSKTIKTIYLTCSGGPFRDYTKNQFYSIDVAKALKHPNWSMGNKITIDSATLFNKVLEIIEARWLFNTKKIKAVLHHESIIHSLVEFNDGSIMAQLGAPSMKIPIAYALNKGQRKLYNFDNFNLEKIKNLSFNPINEKFFPAIKLGYDALKIGGSYAVVLNAANEFMVQKFLANQCHYLDIFKFVNNTVQNHKVIKNPSLKQIKQIHLQTLKNLEKEFY